MSIGANIKKRRYEIGMSQQELAEAMGYKTRSTIAKIESGENDVSQKKLLRFAHALDTSIDTLISGNDSPPKPTNNKISTKEINREKHIAIILAGGRRVRNRQNIPNQFVTIHGKPIIMYCAEIYQTHPTIDEIYIVCLKGWENIIQDYATQFRITKLQKIIPAGRTGMISLKNALNTISCSCEPNDIIFIQEANRPRISAEIISKLLQECLEKDHAILCRYMHDFVQFDVSQSKPKYIDRTTIVEMQSPEAYRLSFLSGLFHNALENNHELTESCCALLMHNLGYEINFLEGNINNLKILREEDILTFSSLAAY